MPVYSSHLLASESSSRVGHRVRNERQRRGLTLREVADRARISMARLSRIETERQSLDVRQAVALAEALGMPWEELLPADVRMPHQISRDAALRARAPLHITLTPAERRRRVAHHNRFWPLADLFVGRHLEPLLGQVKPAHGERLPFYHHHRQSLVFVLRGTIEFLLRTPSGLTREVLSHGDCIYLTSDTPHCVRAEGEEPAETIHVLVAPNSVAEAGLEWPAVDQSVNGSGHDVPDTADLIRRRVVELREVYGWTVAELAARAAVRPRQIQQLEKGAGQLRLETIVKLARAFGKPVRALVGGGVDGEASYFIQRARSLEQVPAHRRALAPTGPGRPPEYQSLAGGCATPEMHPYLVKFANVDQAQLPLHRHRGEELVYVLEGELELVTETEEGPYQEQLQAGDAVYLDSSVAHTYRGRSRNPYASTSAEVITVFWGPLGERDLFAG